MLTIDNQTVSDPSNLAEKFGEFFVSKVNQLSGKHHSNDYKIGHSPLNITITEIKNAAGKLKSKLCQGDDGIPMKIIKDLSLAKPEIFVQIFNSCCTNGIPSAWKVAVVRPLHKKGPKDLVENYRPISNLSLLGKLFEKIILARIDAKTRWLTSTWI